MSLTAAIYGGGPFYAGGEAVINDLKNSGFTTVVAWSLHLNSTGDLIYNDPTIVSNGRYVGDKSWPQLLAQLKQGSTSVSQLIFSVGAGGVPDFTQIQKLITEDGTGPNSILYKNFAALKYTIPTIDAIDFDDEDNYDHKTIIDFAAMLAKIGYRITFCPYTNASFWVDCLYSLNTQNPGLVTQFNLQCYSGGTGNDPGEWIGAIQTKMGQAFSAAGFVFPGLWCRHSPPQCDEGMCPGDIVNKFSAWRAGGLQGGWIWLYDDIQQCQNSNACQGGSMGTSAYAQAILNGLSASNERW